MKKEKQKKPRVKKENNEELRELNAQLGSFGLEPPKIYRQGQKLPENAPRQRSTARNEKANRTKAQQHQTQNKKRRLKKKVRKALYGIALFCGIVAVLLVLSLTVLFKIETITITGNKKYTTKEISAVLPIEKNTNLFMADTDGAEEKVEKNLPYIYDAQIKRHFPSTIKVNITETPKVFYIKNKDKTFTLLDDRFKVLENSASKAPKGIEIRKASLKTATVGETAVLTNEKTLQHLTTLVETVKQMELQDDITAIYSTDINNNYIIYEGRITVKLGSLDKLEDKIYAALTAIEKLNEANPQAEGEMTVGADKQVYFTEK